MDPENSLAINILFGTGSTQTLDIDSSNAIVAQGDSGEEDQCSYDGDNNKTIVDQCSHDDDDENYDDVDY